MKYYEIQKELQKLADNREDSRKAKSATRFLLHMCQKYLWLYEVNGKIESAKNVLQNYLDSEDCLAQRKLKKDRKRNTSLGIVSKLYIEFFWKAYEGHYKKEYGTKTERTFIDSFVNDIDSNKKFDKAWEDIFPDADAVTKSVKAWVNNAIKEWSEYDNANHIKSLKLDNLHTAMDLLKEGLELPIPEIADSVEEVLTPEILDIILEHLKEGRYPHCLFTVAPITRALTTGKPSSYAGTFFNMEYQYNLTELKRYIDRLKEISEEYTEEKQELDKILEQYHYL